MKYSTCSLSTKAVLLFLFVLTNFSLSFGQKVKLNLKIKDAKTEKAVGFTSIFITPCNCGGTADENGLLSIALKRGAHQIISSILGYESDTSLVELKKDMNFTISLAAQGYDLEQVTVVGSDNRANVERTQMGVQQLTATQLQSLPTAIGEVDVLRALTMLPGVGSAGEASNGLSIRGGSLDQNLVLYDDAPIFNPTHLFGLFSVFSPEAVSEVELYRANVPAKYGGRIASVVDVKAKNPDLQDFKMTGGVGFVSSRLAVETPIVKDKLGVLASVRAAHNDFLFRYLDRLKNTKANFVDGTFKLNWKAGERDNFTWTTFYSRDFYQLDINSNINNITASSNQYRYTTWNNTLNWIHSFRDGAFLQTHLVNSEYDPKILFPQTELDNTITYQSAIRYRSLLSEYSKNYNNQFSFSTGIQALQNLLSPGELLPGREENIEAVALEQENALELSAFADATWEASGAFAISAGLRFTQFLLLGAFEEAIYNDPFLSDFAGVNQFGAGEVVQTYNGLEPRIGLRWKLSPRTSVKASYALTRQYLQNIYNSTTPLPTSRWKTADRYIQPQSANTYSLGLYQNINSDQIAMSVETYFRSVDNVLDYKQGADFFLQSFIEQDVIQGKGRSYGVELSFQKPIGKLNGWFNYTWSRSLRQFASEDVLSSINNGEWFASDFDRPHVFNSTLNFQENEFNTFSLNFTYQTGRPYSAANAVFTVDNVNVPIFLERNNARLPAYHRLDFSWRIHNITTKTDKRWKGDWIFTVYNLYGRKNPFNWYYGNASNSSSRNGLGAFQLSIFSTAVVSLAYSFVFQ
ncbi:MAG: TonB-dependent receptor [Bacteroidota bacterium]